MDIKSLYPSPKYSPQEDFLVSYNTNIHINSSSSGTNYNFISSFYHKKHFNTSYYFVIQYLGDWYNVQNVPSIFEAPDPVCQRAQYGSFENGTISLYNSGSYASGEFSEICGWAEQADPENNPGELYIYFPATSG